MSGVARKLADNQNTLNIFLCSMCRVELEEKDKIKIYSDLSKGHEEAQIQSEVDVVENP